MTAAVGCRPAAEAPAAAVKLPADVDVVLVTIDTLRADSVGFAGNTKVATPLLDRLARAGRVFTRAHSHNVVTLPSHTNLLTGRYAFDHGVRDNSGFVVPATVPTLATAFKSAGLRHRGLRRGVPPRCSLRPDPRLRRLRRRVPDRMPN